MAQITHLVAANEALKLENRQLAADNARLSAELSEIGSALGRLTGPSGGRSRRGAGPPLQSEPQARRPRKPITDPELLERRRQALAKARAARAEKRVAERAAVAVAQ